MSLQLSELRALLWVHTPPPQQLSKSAFATTGAGEVAMIQIRSISALLIYSDHTKRGKLLERTQ
jgi:hypothetical protein